MTRSRQIWTSIVTSVALFMVTLDNLVVTTALPSIRVDFGATLASLGWTVNAYTLAFAVLLLPAAALGDRLGRRRVFAAGLGFFTLASIAAALAPSADALIAARAFQGASAAAVMPLSLTLLSRGVPGRQARARARHLVRRQRPRRRARAARRRRRRRGHLVALDLLAQRPDRPRARAARLRAADRVARPRPPARPAAASRSPARACSALVFGIVKAQDLGWTSATVLGSAIAGLAAAGAPSSPGSCARPSRCCRCASSAAAASPPPAA